MAVSALLSRPPANLSSLSAFSPSRISRSACSPSPRAALPSRISVTAFTATRHDSPPPQLMTRPRASPLGTSQRVTRFSRVPLLSSAPQQRHQNSNVSDFSRSSECKRRGAVVSRAFLLPVDPWSPNIDSQSIASSLFAVSLFPYLGFLYFLTRSGTAPRITLFGFYFLLAFVGATIPAGIYAKIHYGTSLSNVDYLHGSAESLLTITNLLIVFGLRKALRDEETSEASVGDSSEKDSSERVVRRQATQQPPLVVLESTEVSVTTAEAVADSQAAATSPSSTQGLPAAVVDAAFAAAEAIAAGVPVTGGGRALETPADVAEGLPPLVDTSARRDSGEEARKKGTRREIPITETDFEREGIQEDEEFLEKDEPMESPVDVTLGEEPGSEGGGGEDVEEVERSPPLDTQATSAQEKAAEEMTTSPAAAGEEITGSCSRAAGRWSLRSHGKAAENEVMRTQEVQEQETRRVKVRMDNNEVTYEINTTAPLKNMFALFCKRLHLPEDGVKFCKNGRAIRGNQTVLEAKLANNCIIDGYVSKDGG
ncbi:unnamed protein product [Closterium sp. NIES-54]